jgi:prepilin-type N-terminal cleavage/methylation domain-containing protein
MNETNGALRREGGYSLIELLTVLVLIAVLTSMAGPAMGRYVQQNKTRRALDRIAMDLSYARLVAVERSQRTWLRVQSNGSYSVDTLATNGVDPVPIKTVDLSSDIIGLSVVTGSATTFEFSSRGMVINYGSESSGGVLKLTAGVARDSLFVSPSGRVYRAF